MDTLREILDFLRNNFVEMNTQFHIKRIGVFGSFAREEQTQKSDVDVLVEFEIEQETFDNYMGLKFFLEDNFKRKVDVVILDSIKESLRKSIMESVKYAKGA